MRIVGPNCQGMLSIQSRVWAAFGSVADETDFRAGSVSCAFQSGGFGYAVVNLAEAQGVGFRYTVSSGNEVDIAMPELLSAFLDDPGTSLAFAYLEGTPDARKLLEVGRKSMETGKPVLIWKAGTTDAGIKAAASHTANMTGSYDLYRAALRQSGIIEVDDVEPIVDLAKLFGQGRLPKGNTVGVLSISGGSGVVFADAAVRGGLTLPPFSPETFARLREMIPAFGSPQNPADITAALFNDKTLFARTLDVVLNDPGLDQLVVLIASISGPSAAHACEMIAAAAAKTDKPVSVQWSGRQAKSEEAAKALAAANVPFTTTPVRLARAAAILARFAADRRRLLPRKTPAVPKPKGVELPAGAVTLNEAESKGVLRAFGVPVVSEVFVPAGADAEKAAKAMEGPFAVKVVSRDVPHKTEAGGVKLGVPREGLAEAARTVSDSAHEACARRQHRGRARLRDGAGPRDAHRCHQRRGIRSGGGARPRRSPDRGAQGRRLPRRPVRSRDGARDDRRAARRPPVRGLSGPGGGGQGGAGAGARRRVGHGRGPGPAPEPSSTSTLCSCVPRAKAWRRPTRCLSSSSGSGPPASQYGASSVSPPTFRGSLLGTAAFLVRRVSLETARSPAIRHAAGKKRRSSGGWR